MRPPDTDTTICMRCAHARRSATLAPFLMCDYVKTFADQARQRAAPCGPTATLFQLHETLESEPAT